MDGGDVRTGADGGDALLRLQHVAVAGDDQRRFAVGDDQHRLQPAQHAVGAPILGQLHRRAHQVALVFFQLGLEAFEQGEGVGGATGEAGQYLVVIQAAHLACGGLDHDIAEGYLAVAAQRHALATAHRYDGSSVKLLHCLPQ